MWLADGDLILNLPPGVPAIAGLALVAVGLVLRLVLKRRTPEQVEPETVRQLAAPPVHAALGASAEGFALLLARRDERIQQLERDFAHADALLDLAYQQGFKPPERKPESHPRPSPGGGTDD